MSSMILLYAGALLTFAWGLSHLFPTTAVVRGFGEISADNRRIVTMEWVTEGVALMFIGVLVALVTYVDRTGGVARAVYWATFAVLNVLSVVSLATGFKISHIAFKMCPFIFSGSSVLVILGSLL